MSTYRCSDLPLLFACGQSVSGEPQAIDVDHDNEAARTGTAAHELIRAHFRGELSGEVAANVCAAHGVEQRSVWPLVNKAKTIVADLGIGAPDRTEEEIATPELSGHPDAEWTKCATYVIGDWKSSRLDGNYYHQLMGYAWLRRNEICAAGGRCLLFVAWLRDGSVERYHVTSDQIDAWFEELRNIPILDVSAPYVTGSHCTYCPRASDCPAQREDMRQTLAVIGEDATLDVSKLDGATVARVHRKLKMLANVKDKWDQALKLRIKELGPVDCGDGHQLVVVSENGKREIDALKAWPIMTARLNDEELAGCLSVGVTALQDAVAKKAPPRKGAEHKRALLAELTEAGAITQGTVWKLKEVRTQNVPETKEIAE